MTKDKTLAAAEVMRRAANGEPVEVRTRLSSPDGEWKVMQNVGWNWTEREYRIVEAPRYRPWTADEVPVGAVVRRPNDGTRAMITASSSGGGIVIGNAVYSGFQLFMDWTVDDGSPCGVRE